MGKSKTRRFSGLGIYTVSYLIFLYGPIMVLPLFSFNDSLYVAFPLKGFTFQWYEDMANNQGLLKALWNSVKVGVTVAVLSTILGTLAAKASISDAALMIPSPSRSQQPPDANPG